MKQPIKPAVLAAAIIAAVLILGYIGWRSFGLHSTAMDQATINAHIAAKRMREGGR